MALTNELGEFLRDVTTTVIVGYFFPFFNREVDRVILNAMTDVQRIYVQMPKERQQETRERMAALRDNIPQLTFLEGIAEFYIPSNFG